MTIAAEHAKWMTNEVIKEHDKAVFLNVSDEVINKIIVQTDEAILKQIQARKFSTYVNLLMLMERIGFIDQLRINISADVFRDTIKAMFRSIREFYIKLGYEVIVSEFDSSLFLSWEKKDE